MDIQNPIINKKKSNEDDFGFSISDEHSEQELTSMGETGKSSGMIGIMHFPKPNFSITNKNRLFNKQIDNNYKCDNFSTYTSNKKFRNDESKINDEIYTEVKYNFINFFIVL